MKLNVINVRIPLEAAGTKLVTFLHQILNSVHSSKKIKQAIEKGACLVNRRLERFASTPLKAGDNVQFDLSLLSETSARLQTQDSQRILYEDEWLLAYNKPPGMISDTTLAALFPRYFLVHRLDKETSGVILFAKNEKIKLELIESFRKFEVKKTYLALVEGKMKKPSGVIENFLGPISREGGSILWGIVSEAKGKYAKTIWHCEEQGKLAALVKCFPETGRTHQLRIHLHSIGHSILGDDRYTKQKRRVVLAPELFARRCMLHSSEIKFPHPKTKEMVSLTAPIPEDFKLLIEVL